MAVLVFGATGNIGRQVVRYLVDAGSEVVAFVRESERGGRVTGTLTHPAVRLAYGDLATPATVRRAAAGMRAVFLLTPHSSDQVSLQNAAVDAAADAGARVVKVSSWGPAMYATTPVPGARRHWRTQQYIIERGVPYTFLHPNHFMQVMTNLYGEHVRRTGVLPCPAGQARISMVDVRDVAEAAARVLVEEGHHGRTYTLSGATAVSYFDIAERLSELSGQPVQARDGLTWAQFADFMASVGRADWDAEHAWAIYQRYRAGIGELVTEDVQRLTGHPPRTVDAFLAEVWPQFAGPPALLPLVGH
jgi:uncharacterized protein YbjT (DUF2867 family)